MEATETTAGGTGRAGRCGVRAIRPEQAWLGVGRLTRQGGDSTDVARVLGEIDGSLAVSVLDGLAGAVLQQEVGQTLVAPLASLVQRGVAKRVGGVHLGALQREVLHDTFGRRVQTIVNGPRERGALVQSIGALQVGELVLHCRRDLGKVDVPRRIEQRRLRTHGWRQKRGVGQKLTHRGVDRPVIYRSDQSRKIRNV